MTSNSNGSGFELCISALLNTRYKKVIPQWKSGWLGLFGQEIRCDFCCDDLVVYEIKFQDSRGTVENKIVHAVEQIKQCHQLPTILIVGGSGYSQGCLTWVKNQVQGQLIAVQNVDEFVSGLTKGA